MAHMLGNKFGIMVYLRPETFRTVEDMRNPYDSASAHCAKLIEKALEAKV